MWLFLSKLRMASIRIKHLIWVLKKKESVLGEEEEKCLGIKKIIRGKKHKMA